MAKRLSKLEIGTVYQTGCGCSFEVTKSLNGMYSGFYVEVNPNCTLLAKVGQTVNLTTFGGVKENISFMAKKKFQADLEDLLNEEA